MEVDHASYDHASYDHERYSQPHPDPQPSDHRKVELQSPLDLTYLQENFAKAALEKLNYVLPDNPSQPKPATIISLDGLAPGKQKKSNAEEAEEETEAADPLKQEVRDLVSEFLSRTWQSAQNNLSLNGIDAMNIPVPHTATLSKAPQSTTSQQEDGKSIANITEIREREGVHFTYTQFDPRLQHKLASLHGELEKLTAEVSKLRREAPQQTCMKHQTALDAQMALDDQEAEAEANSNTAPNGSEKDADLKLNLTPVRPGWSADVQQNYTYGVNQLLNLAGLSSSTTSNTNTNSNDSDKTTSTNPTTSSQDIASNMPRDPSLTETMGKAIRARDVLMEME